jgi:hypothetical protein
MVVAISFEVHDNDYSARNKLAKVERRVDELEDAASGSMPESEAAACFDLAYFWVIKLRKALDSGKSHASNFHWFSASRCDEVYIQVLQDMLGDAFTIEYMKGPWGGEWTQISW